MHKLSDIIRIDKRFQNSINLHFDLDNIEKSRGYIPTRASIAILYQYLEHIKKNQDKANILIGPYGKGKSHLLLVLLNLLRGNEKAMRTVIEKIKIVDKNTADLAENILGKKFMPVIVSGTYSDLNKAFIAAISEALKREGLEELIPDSYFNEAVKTIENWKENYKNTYVLFQYQLRKNGMTGEEMLIGLERGEKEKIILFEKLYEGLTSGSNFNPMVEIEAVKLYREINEIIGKTKGYSGIYIVFDEFSKYVEGHERENFSHDMKILQDMCELSAVTNEYQIHITFVAHKSIKEYGNALPKEMINAFTGVEGRIKEIRFIVSAGNNYELIRHVVDKKYKDYEQFVQENSRYGEIIEKSYHVPCFESIFSKEEYMKIVSYGSFPLLPLSSYCLLNISEKVAQNERSIFTFLSNDEYGSLLYFIKKSNEMFGADVIYDYFENLFRESKSMPEIHNEWLQADFALSRAETDDEKKVIKVLALFRMIRKTEELPITKEKIRLASGIEWSVFDNIINSLEKKQLIVFRPKLGAYAFKHNVGINIENEIDKLVKIQNENINVSEKLGEISELDFVLPRRYNQEYTMTRFFKYIFVSEKQFRGVAQPEYLFEESQADGLIVCIIRDNESKIDRVQRWLEHLNDKRIIVIYPDNVFSEENNIRKLIAVRKLLMDKDFTEENKVLIQELKIYKENLIFEVNRFLENNYMPENNACTVLHENKELDICSDKEFNRLLSEICSEYYHMAPKINNELINRNYVSSQIKKARRKIVTNILRGDDFSEYHKGTGPEATIFRAAMYYTGILEDKNNIDVRKDKGTIYLIDEVKSFIQNSAGRKTSFSKLYEILTGRGLGARKGIIPIFLARELSVMQGTPIIYFNQKEVEITGEIFENINDRPDDYYLLVERESVRKEEYLNRLERLFLYKHNFKYDNSHNRLGNIVDGIQRWYRNLPQYTLNTKKGAKDNYFYQFRNLFRTLELNPRDILFVKIPDILCEKEEQGEDKYIVCTNKINDIVGYFNSFLKMQKQSVVTELKYIFHTGEEESLSACLKGWYQGLGIAVKNQIWNDSVESFISCIQNMNMNDEIEIASALSKSVYGIYIEDWNDNSGERFFNEIRDIKEQMESVRDNTSLHSGNYFSFTDSEGNRVEKFYEVDEENSTSYFLQNAIEDALDEFGGTLEINQKLSVLIQTINNLLKR